MGKKNLPSQNKSARKRKEKSQGKRLQNCNFSLSVCGAFRAVGGNTCGLKASMWAGKLEKICIIPVREAGLNFFLVGSCKSAVPSWESYCTDISCVGGFPVSSAPSLPSPYSWKGIWWRRRFVSLLSIYKQTLNLCASKAQLSKLI